MGRLIILNDSDLIKCLDEDRKQEYKIPSNVLTLYMHGCNCFRIMGAGIAKSLKKYDYLIYTTDVNDHAYYHNSNSKLGNYSIRQYTKKLKLINAYTQENLGANFNIHSLNLILHKIVYNEFKNNNHIKRININMPYIGCGIGGYDKNKLEKELRKTLKEINNSYSKTSTNIILHNYMEK